LDAASNEGKGTWLARAFKLPACRAPVAVSADQELGERLHRGWQQTKHAEMA
jgi:hypothetical protein